MPTWKPWPLIGQVGVSPPLRNTMLDTQLIEDTRHHEIHQIGRGCSLLNSPAMPIVSATPRGNSHRHHRPESSGNRLSNDHRVAAFQPIDIVCRHDDVVGTHDKIIQDYFLCGTVSHIDVIGIVTG